MEEYRKKRIQHDEKINSSWEEFEKEMKEISEERDIWREEFWKKKEKKIKINLNNIFF